MLRMAGKVLNDEPEQRAARGIDRITGLIVISAEPTELTFVPILGPIDLDRLADLEGHVGIPKVSKEQK